MEFEFNRKSCPWLVKKSLFSKPGKKDKDGCLATKGPCQSSSCAPYHWVTYINMRSYNIREQTQMPAKNS